MGGRLPRGQGVEQCLSPSKTPHDKLNGSSPNLLLLPHKAKSIEELSVEASDLMAGETVQALHLATVVS